MNGIEVKTRLTEIQNELETALVQFVLTDKIKKLVDEANELKVKCEHNFVNGVCEYCGTKENNE